MTTIFTFLIFAGFVGTAIFMRLPRSIGFVSSGLLLLLASIFTNASVFGLSLLWLLWLITAGLIWLPMGRRRYITVPLLRYFRKSLPPLSETERIALESGDVWWESDLLSGRPNWHKLLQQPPILLTEDEKAFLDNQVNTLCKMVSDWDNFQNGFDLPAHVWQYLKTERFLGLVIPKKYDGLGFSALAHSTIVAKIATRSVSTAVSMMVPNSLGPAELLLHYGNESQKNHYLPRLARGEEIPCFALTGIEAGSDAASISDCGVVCRDDFQGQMVIGIRLSWDKRYITLAPIATLLGLAFKLYDPEHLLGAKEEIGITLALIPTMHPGVVVGERHMPLGLSFMNGPTSGKNVFIPLSWVIGGGECVGKGWQMLMACLGIGRAISLPALSAGCGHLAARTTGAYARIRKQFHLPLWRFEGVAENLAEIAVSAYQLEATRKLTIQAVMQNLKPTVASAIAKYHMTELARTTLHRAMDVHAGRGIQMGPRNYLAFAEQAMPMSITVEGANILTRNLIIFGQGAIRCHPYLQAELKAVTEWDGEAAVYAFDEPLAAHLGYTASNLLRTFIFGLTNAKMAKAPKSDATAPYFRQLSRFSSALALIADASLLVLGGQLKRRELLSARLGDVLSALYMSSAILKHYHEQGALAEDLPLVIWAIKRHFCQIESSLYDFFANFPVKWLARTLQMLVFPLGRQFRSPSDQLALTLAAKLVEPSAFRERLTSLCFVGEGQDDPLGRLEYTLLKITAAHESEQKLLAAIAEGKVQRRLSFAEQVQLAGQIGVLTHAEMDLLLEAEAARLDAIQVDSFAADFFMRGRKSMSNSGSK